MVLAVGMVALPAARADEPVSVATGERLLAQYHCDGCHTAYTPLVGPTLHDVAVRYASDPTAIGDVESSILNGSVGAWGAIGMAPVKVPASDLQPLVEWILALR